MKKLTKREKIMIMTASILLFIYAYFRLLLLPIITDIRSTISNVYTLSETLKTQNLSKNINEQNKKKLEELKTKLSETFITLPESERSPEIAYDLKAIADENGIIINSLSFSEGAAVNNAGQGNLEDQSVPQALLSGVDAAYNIMLVPVALQVTGEYRNVLNFIHSIESNERIAEISSVAMGDGENAVTSSININYVYIGGLIRQDVQYEFNKGTYGKDNLFK